MRISIVGFSGSGKTTLAEMLSKKLSVPHIQLDRFWFEAGGLEVNRYTPDFEKERIRSYIWKKTMESTQDNSWVSDGFYSRIQPDIAKKADVIIFLDIPLWRRLINHTLRISIPSRRHKELKIWNEVAFFSEIVRRTFTNEPKYEKFLKEYGHKIVALRSRKEIKNYIDHFPGKQVI